MKRFVLLALFCLLPQLGRPQAVIHQAALDQLAGLAPPAPAPASSPKIHHVVVYRVRHRRLTPKPDVLAFEPPPSPAAKPSPSATVKTTPPPLTAKPVPALARPAPPPIVALRFAAGSADLPPGAAAALKPVCTAAEPSGAVSVDAAAPGVAGDPSVAMRLAMQRAFAVRDALAACGISPARIIPRANGAAGNGAAGGGDLDITQVKLGAGP